ncbi:MAPEG family protein [Agaribacter marinus]|uniref:Membrane protein n=1 Tax=Agaribacter marinus TaxID=1431249 RepID=A0AA37T224_9ALTE|nr:MAPEG family protein [Agaribacter marinus]GLR72389.1 membrane protein [Agaribacter marinus]
METTYFYLALSGLLTISLWIPYIISRAFTWGIPLFLHNYPENYPKQQPEAPLWAQRSLRAHLNMVETLPAFVSVVLAAGVIAPETNHAAIAQWAQIFFIARVSHAIVYTLGIPFLRTPVYLISWLAILMIGIATL